MANATHIREANNAKLKEDSIKLKKLYILTLLIPVSYTHLTLPTTPYV